MTHMNDGRPASMATLGNYLSDRIRDLTLIALDDSKVDALNDEQTATLNWVAHTAENSLSTVLCGIQGIGQLLVLLVLQSGAAARRGELIGDTIDDDTLSYIGDLISNLADLAASLNVAEQNAEFVLNRQAWIKEAKPRAPTRTGAGANK